MTDTANSPGRDPNGIVDNSRATIGRIFSQTFILTKENILFGLIVFALAFAAIALIGLATGGAASLDTITDPVALQRYFDEIGFAGTALLIGAFVFLFVIAYTVLFARMALKYRGEEHGLAASLQLALKRFLRVLGVAVVVVLLLIVFVFLAGLVIGIIGGALSSLGPWVAFALGLVIYLPLVWISVRLLPIAGVMMTEDEAGVFGSISRGYALSSGRWWRIFIASLLVAVTVFVMTFVAGFVVAIPFIGWALYFVVTSIASLIYSALYMATYFELRAAKEGGLHSQVAEVFD